MRSPAWRVTLTTCAAMLLVACSTGTPADPPMDSLPGGGQPPNLSPAAVGAGGTPIGVAPPSSSTGTEPKAPLATPALVITEPAAGAKWAVGALHWISWSGLPKNASIEVSYDGGVVWEPAQVEPATAYVPNTAQRHLWRVPTVSPGAARFRAVDPVSGARSSAVTITIIPSQQGAYQWENRVEEPPYASRDGAALESFNGKLMLLGGWNRAVFDLFTTNEVWTSSDGASWTPGTAAAWEARHSFGHAILNDKLFVFGGDALQGHYQPDVWSTSDGVAWQKVLEVAPWGNRALHYTVAHAGALWVLGGQTLPAWVDSPDPVTFFNDVWRSPDGVTWTQVLAHAPWAGRGAICGQAVFNGEIWVLGGGTYDTVDVPTRTLYSDAWSSADGVSWKRHADPPWFPREYHDVAVYDGRLWVMAGYTFSDDANHDDVWYSADGENWYDLPGTPWETRHAGAATATSEGLWITTGDTNSAAVYVLTPTPSPPP